MEYYHYPSARAEKLWFYVLSIGRATVGHGHQHGHPREDRFLFHYLRKGEFWYRSRERLHRAKAGDVCLMDLRHPVDYGNDHVQPSNLWWVCFGGKDMPDSYVELAADENPIFQPVDSTRVEGLFGELFDITKRKPPGYEAHASGLLGLLLAELFASRDDRLDADLDLVKLSTRQASLSEPVRKGLRYIVRFYHEDALALKHIAVWAGLTLFHFSRLFQREVGMSPIHYLNHYRVEKAKRILLTSDHPVSEIGQMVGIRNPSKFGRLFRQVTGATPSQYRAQGK